MTDERMAAMRRWLETVCAELGLDPALLDGTSDELLALVGHVAHGPSRPGAPLTAFLVGLATGSAGRELGTQDTARAVNERIADVERLVAAWTAR